MADMIKDKDLEGVNGGLKMGSDESDYTVSYEKEGEPGHEPDTPTNAGNYTPGISLDNKGKY